MRELAIYLGAGVAYVGVGVAEPSLLLSFFEGGAFLLLAVWIVPTLVRRLTR